MIIERRELLSTIFACRSFRRTPQLFSCFPPVPRSSYPHLSRATSKVSPHVHTDASHKSEGDRGERHAGCHRDRAQSATCSSCQLKSKPREERKGGEGKKRELESRESSREKGTGGGRIGVPAGVTARARCTARPKNRD